MRRPLLVLFASSVLAAAASIPAAAGSPSETTSGVLDAASAFEALKGLEGTWTGTVAMEEGGEGRQTTIVYEVSAGGHSVIETFGPGTPMEMFSVYHLDGDDLLMTHYCAIGNAPRMKLAPSDKPGELVFEFNGGSNMDPEKDAHAHEGRMQLLGPDEYASQAVGYSEGEPSSIQYFSMKREP